MPSSYRNIKTICAVCQSIVSNQRIRTGEGNTETWEDIYVSDCKQCSSRRAQERYDAQQELVDREFTRQSYHSCDCDDDDDIAQRRRCNSSSSGGCGCGCLFMLAVYFYIFLTMWCIFLVITQ